MRKVGKLYRKPIVEANPNLISKNQINIDDVSSGKGGGSTDAKYLGFGVVNINGGFTHCYAYPSECTTWGEAIDSINTFEGGTNLFISNGYVHTREGYLASYPLYYDAELTQMVSETDKPLSQDYYIEGYSGGGSGN